MQFTNRLQLAVRTATTLMPSGSRCHLVMLASVLCFSYGCTVASVNDLRLREIEVVDPSVQSVPVELESWAPKGRLLRIVLVTGLNVRDTAKRYNLYVRADAYSCVGRKHELAKLEILFDADGVIGEELAPSRSAGGSELWFYVVEKSDPRKNIETGLFSVPAYDLVQHPHDICVQLHARNMALQGFSSNVVRIHGHELARYIENQ